MDGCLVRVGEVGSCRQYATEEGGALGIDVGRANIAF